MWNYVDLRTTQLSTNILSPVYCFPNVNSLGDGVTFPQCCADEDTDTLLGGCQRWIDPDGTGEHADSDSSTAPPNIVIMN